MMLHLAEEKKKHFCNLWCQFVCVCVERGGGGGGRFQCIMYDEKYGRPICGYSSLFYCFLGNIRLPVFSFGHSTKFQC